MGTFSVDIMVGNMNTDYMELLEEVIVDTGASHTMLPTSFLNHLEVHPATRRTFKVAVGDESEMDMGFAWISMNGDKVVCPVIFGPDDRQLLGATTLEILGLVVDTEGETLVPRQYIVRPI